MTLELEQEDSIAVIQSLVITPIESKVDIEVVGNEKLITRAYHIGSCKYYPEMEWIIVSYKVGGYTEKVKDYAVYLQSKNDKVYLCKYSPEIINTLFNNIVLLEISNWRRTIHGLKPLKNIDDYSSFKFKVDSQCKKSFINLLYKTIEKNTSSLFSKFKQYCNTNEAIPAEVWQSRLV